MSRRILALDNGPGSKISWETGWRLEFGRAEIYRRNPHSHCDGFPRCLNRPLSESCVDRTKAWQKLDDGTTAGNSSSALLGNIIRNLHVDHGLLPMNLGESLIDIWCYRVTSFKYLPTIFVSEFGGKTAAIQPSLIVCNNLIYCELWVLFSVIWSDLFIHIVMLRWCCNMQLFSMRIDPVFTTHGSLLI